MSATKAIAKLLKLHKFLKVTDICYRRDGAVILNVKPYKNGACCPKCGRRGTLLRTRPNTRLWRDLPVAGREVFFADFPREIVCPSHGRHEEVIPWAAPHARITTRLEYALLRLCQAMSQKAAAELLRLSSSTLSDQLHRSITRRRSSHHIRGLRVIGTDEIPYHKRHQYATLVYGLERPVVASFQHPHAQKHPHLTGAGKA